MERLIEKSGHVWRICTIIGGIFMVISALLIVVNVILRRFFNAPIFGSTELVQYLGLCITSFAIVQNEWGEGNVTMALLVDKLPRKTHYLVNVIEYFLEVVVFLVVDYLLVKDTLTKIAKGNLTAELRFPKWIPSAIVAFGFILLTIVIAIKAILYIMALKNDKTLDFEKIGRIE